MSSRDSGTSTIAAGARSRELASASAARIAVTPAMRGLARFRSGAKPQLCNQGTVHPAGLPGHRRSRRVQAEGPQTERAEGAQPLGKDRVLRAVLAQLPTRGQPSLRPTKMPGWTLVVHGGAGVIASAVARHGAEAYLCALREALDAGRHILAAGGSALDAVEAAVRVLEDSPLFNAGRGSVFAADGTHRMEASLQDGRTRQAGAVLALQTTRHPTRARGP